MTAPTPQQMRELADKNDAEAEAWRGFSKTSGRIALHEESAAALRTAAGEIEAVQRLTELTPSMVHPITREPVDVVYASDLLAILTVDTALQEGRDD